MKCSFVLLSVVLAAAVHAQMPSLIPMPRNVTLHPGSFQLQQSSRVDLADAGSELGSLIRTTLALRGAEGVDSALAFKVRPNLATLGREGYHLNVSGNGVVIEAPNQAGLFNGLQTLRQLLPDSIEEGRWPRNGASVRYVDIWDEPKFQWRGLHLDVSRHFFPKPFIKRYLDLMALQKLNVFHWHLVDDGGWRVEIKKYPELTRRGAFRAVMEPVWAQKEVRFPDPGTSEPKYGGFYTQDDIKEIVAYAKARNIEVVPEIEMPGHTQPVMWSYPELMCQDADIEEFRLRSGNQRPNVYCAGNERTFAFIEDVLREVSSLFPSKYIHIGGDEVDKYLWEHCPLCGQRMKEEGFADTGELQSYFVKRVEGILKRQGRSLIGWDEILEGGLAPEATVMSWRGVSGGIEAAKSAHDVIMSPTSHCYFDYSYQSIPNEAAFGFNPVPDDLTRLESQYVIGAQANVWTEWIPDGAKAEQMVFPRILGLSEALWNGDPNRTYDEFRSRLRGFFPRLDVLGVNYYVPAPEAEFDAVILDGPTDVKFLAPPVPGAVIRYTLDGSSPTADSPIYAKSVRVDKPCVVTGALFLPKGQHSDPITIHCAARPSSAPSSLEPGLWLRAAKGVWDKVPSFANIQTTPPRKVDEVGLYEYDDTEEFAVEFTGFIKIERDGVYAFSLKSDDGSILDIAGARVVDNDGLHGPVEKTGRIRLSAGVYPVTIAMFEAGGGDVLEVSVAGPGIEKQALPSGMILRSSN